MMGRACAGWLALALLIPAAAQAQVQAPTAAGRTAFDLETATVADINRAIDAGALSSERLVELSLARIAAYEPGLNALITVNPRALDEARALDAERRARGRRSPLHGIPVIVKDNIDTRDLPTSLGFYGLEGAVPLSDAAVIARLRAAGAIILAKTNLSELASGPPMSSAGGQTRNPHDPAYNPAGSSNGTAVGVAAGYAPLGIATDTTGSARWPAAVNGVVGLRPTWGAISTAGVQPNAPTLDAVGPITRTVADAAQALSLLRDAGGGEPADVLSGLTPEALQGARIGFPKNAFSGDDPEIDAAMAAAIEALKAAGAVVVEVELPDWLIPLSGDLQAILVRTESAPSLNAYLEAAFPPGWPRSHAEILAMTEALVAGPGRAGATPNPGRLDGYRWEAGAAPLTDPVYLAGRDQGRQLVRASLQAVLDRDDLDAIVSPTQTTRINRIGEPPKRNARGLFGNFGPVLASLAGWPELTVPAGLTADGLPMGVSFLGPADSEPRLLGYGFAFERRADGLRQPATTPPLPGDRFGY